VRDLLERGLDPRDAADAGTFARVAQLEAAVADEAYVWPSMRWEEQKRRLAGLQKSERFKLAALWRVLRDAAGRGGPLRRVELRRDEPTADGELQDRLHVWWRAPLRVPEAPVLLLDASLDERLARKLFPRIQVETIAARRNAEVVQVADTPCSRNRLLSFEGRRTPSRPAPPTGWPTCAASPRSRRAGGACCSSPTRPPRSGSARSPASTSPTSGRLRGLDRYRGHDTIVVAGREQPPPAEVEGLARSLFGDDEEPLVLPGGYTTATRGYRLRDGTRRGVEVAVHPDPRCQAILEQVRERETEQAVDRLRLVHRERPARVLVLVQPAARPHRRPAGDVAGGGAGPAGGRRRPPRRRAAARPGLAGGAVPRPVGDLEGRQAGGGAGGVMAPNP
jgi:hypothetical protein